MSNTRFLQFLGLVGAVTLAAAGTYAAGGRDGFRSETKFVSATPWTSPPIDDGGPLRFAVIGDRTGVARPGVFPQAMRQIGWLAPDFIIAVGDLIEGYTDDAADLNRQWDGLASMVAGAGRPFIYVPGNHDLSNPAAERVWTSRHGQPWYAFTFKSALFVVLDTEDPPAPLTPEGEASFHALVDRMNADIDAGDKAVAESFAKRTAPTVWHDAHIGAQQVAFLRQTLARHPDARWTFLFFHKPDWKSDDPNWLKIEAALAGRRYTVFAGHLHYFEHTVRDGHDYFDMATTGAIAHREGPGTMDHTLLVTLTKTGPVYANIKLTGLADLNGETGQTHALDDARKP